jgi:hypothetical protein
MAPSIKRWPQEPIVMGSKSPVAADVARHASQIVHFSEMKSGRKRGLYDRRTVFVLVLAVAAHTNLFEIISASCIILDFTRRSQGMHLTPYMAGPSLLVEAYPLYCSYF